MSVTASVYGPEGRAPGSYVYVFLCENAGRAIIKVGVSDNPERRLGAIRSGCPFRHLRSVMVNVYTRDVAFEIESEVLKIFKPWKTQGEWLSFDLEEKPIFNTRFREVLERYRKPGWPLKVVSTLERRTRKREAEKRELAALKYIFEVRTHSEAVDRMEKLFRAALGSCKRTPTVS